MDNSKHSEISRRILQLVQAGHSMQEAIDRVLGEGTYESLVDNLYTQLRARKA